MLLLLLIAITLTYIWLIKMRQNLNKKVRELDLGVATPSDFCLMGKHMIFESYDPDSIKADICAELKATYDIDEIVYVNPVYDISNYYQIVCKYNEIIKLKVMTDAHMKSYCDENKCDKDQYKLVIKSAECPEEAPKRKEGTFSTRPCDPDEIDGEIAKL